MAILNIGADESGYLSDAYVPDGRTLRRLSISIVPDGVGLTEHHLYIHSASDELDPSSMSMVRVPLDGSSSRQTWTWKPWGSDEGWLPNFYSDLFLHDGRVWFLEDNYPTDGDGNPTEFSTDHRSQLRLASIHLSDGVYESRYLADSKSRSRIESSRGWNSAAQATIGAHRRGETLFWVDSHGQILSVRLGATTVRPMCRVLRRTSSAENVRASWNGDSLSLAAVNGDRAWLETVAISPPCSRSVRDVPSIAHYLKRHPDQVMSGYATRPRDSSFKG